MARRKKKGKTHVTPEGDANKKGIPKSFVFWRGQYGLVLKFLEADLRKVMQPYTASKLKESHKNQLKDFLSIAGPLGVSQFLVLSATEQSCYLRLAKIPQGPTLTMRIHKYSLIRDVIASQQRPRQAGSLWKTSPLVIMSNFGETEHLKLASRLFQNMFPSINVQTTKLASCQRVLLLSYDKSTNLISLRHYSIRAQPSGVTKAVKQLISRRQVPDLSSFKDATEFLTKSGYGSESEGEEAASSRVTLAQDLGRGNLASRQSRVVLQEIGPRMELEIMKAEEGVCAGQVLYHRLITRSPEEVAAQKQAIKSREELRKRRKQEQEENVKRKAKKRKEQQSGEVGGEEGDTDHKKKRRKKEWWEIELKGRGAAMEEDDDAEYYRQEVGEEPNEMHGFRAKAGSNRAAQMSRKGKLKPSKPDQKPQSKGKESWEKTLAGSKVKMNGKKKGKKT